MKKYKYNIVNLNDLNGKSMLTIREYVRFNGYPNFKDDDAECLLSLIDNIYDKNRDGFVISYMIERICKEFDLIKMDDNAIINIEMKLSNRGDKIKQVVQNYNLLSNQYPFHSIIIYSYIKENNMILKYNIESKELVESTFIELNEDLEKVENYRIPNINFNIKSIYQNPNFFLEGSYFLSNSQEDIKKEILKNDSGVFAINGCGGTGKSLLALDLYKTLRETKDTVFLVPFAQQKIIDEELTEKMNIRTERYYRDTTIKEVIIVDEAQRIKYFRLKDLQKRCKYLVLFYDEYQDIDDVGQIQIFLEDCRPSLIEKKLKQVIRNDNTMDRFARKICGYKKNKFEFKTFDDEKINIYMISEFEKLDINKDDYKIIEPSKSKMTTTCESICFNKKCFSLKQRFQNEIVHFEIGKEYKNVLLYLCNGYCVKNNKIDMKLPVSYGSIRNQIYTIISRAVERIIIICDDIELYNFLMKCKEELTN